MHENSWAQATLFHRCSVSSTHRLATLCEISFFPIPNQTFSLFPVHFSLSFAAHPQKEPDTIFAIFCHQILENFLIGSLFSSLVQTYMCCRPTLYIHTYVYTNYIHMYTQISEMIVKRCSFTNLHLFYIFWFFFNCQCK